MPLPASLDTAALLEEDHPPELVAPEPDPEPESTCTWLLFRDKMEPHAMPCQKPPSEDDDDDEVGEGVEYVGAAVDGTEGVTPPPEAYPELAEVPPEAMALPAPTAAPVPAPTAALLRAA